MLPHCVHCQRHCLTLCTFVDAEGNKRFRNIVDQHIEKYQEASSKLEKTLAVSSVIDSIREKGGAFVRQNPPDSGKWVEVEDKLAREKVGQAIRAGLRKRKSPDGEDMKKSPASGRSSATDSTQGGSPHHALNPFRVELHAGSLKQLEPPLHHGPRRFSQGPGGYDRQNSVPLYIPSSYAPTNTAPVPTPLPYPAPLSHVHTWSAANVHPPRSSFRRSFTDGAPTSMDFRSVPGSEREESSFAPPILRRGSSEWSELGAELPMSLEGVVDPFALPHVDLRRFNAEFGSLQHSMAQEMQPRPFAPHSQPGARERGVARRHGSGSAKKGPSEAEAAKDAKPAPKEDEPAPR